MKTAKAKDNHTPQDRFMAGGAHRIFLSWEHFQPRPEEDYEGNNEITCFFEFNGVSIFNSIRGLKRKDITEKTDVDLSFLSKAIFKNDILPALQTWAQQKVDNEHFGGLYDSTLSISITLSTHREIREDDPPHMQGVSWEQSGVCVRDEKRIATRRQLVHDLIAKEEYLTENIDDYDSSLDNICRHATQDFFEEFAEEKLLHFFNTLLQKAKDQEHDYVMRRVISGLISAAAVLLTRTQDEQVHTEAELSLGCKICMLILLNHTDKYERDSGINYLKAAAEQGYKEAKNIIKYGTGQIPMNVLVYKDKLVDCSANDIDKVVTFKIKEESPEA